METTTELMKSMARRKDMGMAMDMAAMQEAIDACSTCMQACTMCSDAMGGMDGMAVCASRCAMCAEVCGTTMRMLMRPAGMERTAMIAMLEACTAMCAACMEECRTHADMSATCAMCADACEACDAACSRLLASMTADAV
ncbi:hypothetical protein GCM10025783_15470 [Amnibacterium soli]|uniref:Four-helix bundle copper-binding protein n=1 Tax=Amnibacterium soli TaxID=1282736 RepID=A0ABP8Z2K4_9MICO